MNDVTPSPELGQPQTAAASPAPSLTPECFLVAAGERFHSYCPGCVYVIQWGDDGPVKIGLAVSPVARLAELQVANWMELRLVAALPFFSRLPELERAAHAVASEYKIRGEWFDLHPVEAVECVMAAASSLGVELMTRDRAVAVERARFRAEIDADEKERRRKARVAMGIE